MLQRSQYFGLFSVCIYSLSCVIHFYGYNAINSQMQLSISYFLTVLLPWPIEAYFQYLLIIWTWICLAYVLHLRSPNHIPDSILYLVCSIYIFLVCKWQLHSSDYWNESLRVTLSFCLIYFTYPLCSTFKIYPQFSPFSLYPPEHPDSSYYCPNCFCFHPHYPIRYL